MKIILTLLILLVAIGAMAQQTMWDMKELSKAPKVYEYNLPLKGDKEWGYGGVFNTDALKAKDKENNYIKSIMYKGVDFQGKETRVFAWIGIPPVAKGQKIPAMVLVDGGGGTAFEYWVRLWNSRGYAAIAMDTCGSIPVGDYGNWQRHEYTNNTSWGDFEKVNEPVKDQWTYQAVSAVILANSLMRSYPQIDKTNIGITGISWGGYLTSIISSVDYRFKFAVPVYGCGSLKENSAWSEEIKNKKLDKWVNLWDPINYLKYSKVPTHWVTGNKDFAYWPIALKNSYDAIPKNKYLHIIENMPHGHAGAGENPGEIYAIAEEYTKGKKILPYVINESYVDYTFTFTTTKPVEKAMLFYTSDSNPNGNSNWNKMDMKLVGNKATITVPNTARVFFADVYKNGLVTSSQIHTNAYATGNTLEETIKAYPNTSKYVKISAHMDPGQVGRTDGVSIEILVETNGKLKPIGACNFANVFALKDLYLPLDYKNISKVVAVILPNANTSFDTSVLYTLKVVDKFENTLVNMVPGLNKSFKLGLINADYKITYPEDINKNTGGSIGVRADSGLQMHPTFMNTTDQVCMVFDLNN